MDGSKSSIISIHALLAESDVKAYRQPAYHTEFLSTLSLRRATLPTDGLLFLCAFLSTLSLRRATRWARSRRRRSSDFYPRSPCGERRQGHLHAGNLRHFYPRSPCGERPTAATPILKSPYFYPRSPCGERLYDTYAKVLRVNISIHALLAESDNNINSSVNTADQISIHALLAESDIRNSPALLGNTQFLSTLSLRRAT